MQIIQSSLARAVSAIIMGVLLIKYREQTVTWLTIVIGILFFLSGVISCAAYFVARRRESDVQLFDAEGRQLSGFKVSFPLTGLGSIVLGLILALMPNAFISWLMFILAAILIIGAIGQFVSLAAIARTFRVGIYFWIMPSVILLVGLRTHTTVGHCLRAAVCHRLVHAALRRIRERELHKVLSAAQENEGDRRKKR